MNNFNYTFLLSAAVIGTGYLFKVLGILTEDHGKSLSKIIINVTLPALILTTISKIELDFSLAVAPVIGVLFALLVSGVSAVVFRSYGTAEKGVARMTSVGFNIGLFAYPIIEELFGTPGLSTVAMLDFGNAFIVFGLCYLLGFMHSEKRGNTPLEAKHILLLFLKSVPFMSYIIAVLINISGFAIPGAVDDFLGIFAKANTGMALIVLGLTLNFRFDKSHWGLIFKVIGLRYAAGLAAGLLLYVFLPYSAMYRTVILFGLLLPVAMSVIPYSVEFDLDVRISSTIANFTMILSFFFMWFFMSITAT